MDILLNCDSLMHGGAEKHITELALQLSKEGHNVSLASWSFHHTKQEILSKEGIKVVNKSRQTLDNLLKDANYDIIHGHPFQSLLQTYNLAKKYNIKFGFTIHGMYDIYIDRSPIGFEIASKIAFLIVVDQSIREYISNTPISSSKIHLIPNGVNLDIFYDKQKPLISSKKISYISRYGDGKQIVALGLIDIIHKISDLLPEFSFCFAGDGPYFENIKEKADEVNRERGREVIKIMGWCYDIPTLMRNSEIIIGSERVAIEGLAAGRPVLLLSTGGYGGLVRESNFKELVLKREQHPVDYNDLIYQDVLELTKKEYWIKICKESRKIASENFDLKRIVKKIETLYRD